MLTDQIVRRHECDKEGHGTTKMSGTAVELGAQCLSAEGYTMILVN